MDSRRRSVNVTPAAHHGRAHNAGSEAGERVSHFLAQTPLRSACGTRSTCLDRPPGDPLEAPRGDRGGGVSEVRRPINPIGAQGAPASRRSQ